MTRKKKTKPPAIQKAPSDVATTSPQTIAKDTAIVVSRDNNTNTPKNLYSLPSRNPTHARTSVSSSTINEIASTSSSDKESVQRKKKPVNVKVTYVTEQINIYPKHPVLTVDRLPNIDYHINTLTNSIGKRPRVYPHGKGVRFISETNDEYRTIQRYLAKIESAEKIAWCSHTVPAGNSLKVSVKVRKVDVVKVTEDIQKLDLENGTKPSVVTEKETFQKNVKTSAIDSSIQNDKPATKGGKPTEVQMSTKDNSPVTTNQAPGQSPATNTGLDNKKKKPRDIIQNRSYKKTNI